MEGGVLKQGEAGDGPVGWEWESPHPSCGGHYGVGRERGPFPFTNGGPGYYIHLE